MSRVPTQVGEALARLARGGLNRNPLRESAIGEEIARLLSTKLLEGGVPSSSTERALIVQEALGSLTPDMRSYQEIPNIADAVLKRGALPPTLKEIIHRMVKEQGIVNGGSDTFKKLARGEMKGEVSTRPIRKPNLDVPTYARSVIKNPQALKELRSRVVAEKATDAERHLLTRIDEDYMPLHEALSRGDLKAPGVRTLQARFREEFGIPRERAIPAPNFSKDKRTGALQQRIDQIVDEAGGWQSLGPDDTREINRIRAEIRELRPEEAKGGFSKKQLSELLRLGPFTKEQARYLGTRAKGLGSSEELKALADDIQKNKLMTEGASRALRRFAEGLSQGYSAREILKSFEEAGPLSRLDANAPMNYRPRGTRANAMERWKPEEDSVTHINVYSRGKSELGRSLSNFAHTPFETNGKSFESVEAWWYWQSLKRQGLTDEAIQHLREKYGFQAKELGNKIHKAMGLKVLPPPKNALRQVYKDKLKANPRIQEMLKANKLPLDHYYVGDGGRRIDTGHRWTGQLWGDLDSPPVNNTGFAWMMKQFPERAPGFKGSLRGGKDVGGGL